MFGHYKCDVNRDMSPEIYSIPVKCHLVAQQLDEDKTSSRQKSVLFCTFFAGQPKHTTDVKVASKNKKQLGSKRDILVAKDPLIYWRNVPGNVKSCLLPAYDVEQAAQ